MKPKPGVYEVYPVLLPCAISAGGKHEIKLRLRLSDNRVTFEDACDRRTAEAHDALLSKEITHVTDYSCRPWIILMHDAIKARAVQALDLYRCRTCDAYVPLWHNDCPFQIYDPDDGPTHHVEHGHLAFWDRITRSGRVR